MECMLIWWSLGTWRISKMTLSCSLNEFLAESCIYLFFNLKGFSSSTCKIDVFGVSDKIGILQPSSSPLFILFPTFTFFNPVHLSLFLLNLPGSWRDEHSDWWLPHWPLWHHTHVENSHWPRARTSKRNPSSSHLSRLVSGSKRIILWHAFYVTRKLVLPSFKTPFPTLLSSPLLSLLPFSPLSPSTEQHNPESTQTSTKRTFATMPCQLPNPPLQKQFRHVHSESHVLLLNKSLQTSDCRLSANMMVPILPIYGRQLLFIAAAQDL